MNGESAEKLAREVIAPILIDFESRSRAPLDKLGGRHYWLHPSSEALCCVWYDTRTATVGVWVPGESWPHAGRVLAAHNAYGFDRFAAERYGFNAASWIDTSQLARKVGLPGALDALGTRWCDVPKDDEGSKFTRALSSVRRPAKNSGHEITRDAWNALSDNEKRAHGVMPAITPTVLQRVVTYCASDVQILAEAWPKLREWIPVDAPAERLDTIINDRGIMFDVSLARRLIEEIDRHANAVVNDVARQAGVAPSVVREVAMSPKQFCEATGAPNAQSELVEKMSHPLASARLALASIVRGKLNAGLRLVHEDNRLRDTLLYYGAGTGRWAGRGMQLQNLPRPAAIFEDLPTDTTLPYISTPGRSRADEENRAIDIDAYAEQVLNGRECDPDGVDLLVRATLCASPGHRLIASDFSSVEARATMWAAKDHDALAVITSGRDSYKIAASAVFGIPYEAVTKAQRQIGKCCDLGLGYQGGPNAFIKIAHQYHIDPSVIAALDLRAIVNAWRTLHAPVRSLWYACEHAFRSALKGRAQWAGPFEFVPSKTQASDGTLSVACFLPSGRPVVYQHALLDGHDREGIIYWGTKDQDQYTLPFCPKCWRQLPAKSKVCPTHGEVEIARRIRLYGGKLVENAIQALCRDLLVEALLRAEAAGLRTVLHVHDEIVCEVDESSAEQAAATLHAAMVKLPSWAAGFPLEAKEWIGKRYRK